MKPINIFVLSRVNCGDSIEMSGSENIVGPENVLLESMDSSRYVWAITPVYGASRTKWLNYVLNKVECENCWKCPPGSKEKFLLRQKAR